MKIEELLFTAKWTRCHGPDREQNQGFKEALKFCINKHKESWTIKDFEQDYIYTEELMKGMYGPYKDGMLYGLRLNLDEMRKGNFNV